MGIARLIKTKVEISIDDAYREKRYRKGEKGYVGGYLTDKDGSPIVVVVLGSRLVFVQPCVIKVIERRISRWLRQFRLRR
jgi:hypothetical protein